MSQFASLFKNESAEKAAQKPKRNPRLKQEKKKPVAATAATPLSPVVPQGPAVTATVKPEKRAAGKSSNPDYTQVLTYVRKDTHNEVKAALIFDERKRDLSDLVEELLADWIRKNKSS